MPKYVRWKIRQRDRHSPRQYGSITQEEDSLANTWIAKGYCEEIKNPFASMKLPDEPVAADEPEEDTAYTSKTIEAPSHDRAIHRETSVRKAKKLDW